VLALEHGWGDWKAGEVGRGGEEVKDLKEDDRGEQVVTAVVLGVLEEENGGELESERLYVGQP